MSKVFTLKNIALGILIIIIDLAVYIFLGLLMMNYEDFYDESEGEYWSLASMTTSEKITYIGLNLWCLINVLLIIYLIYRIIKRTQESKTPYNT